MWTRRDADRACLDVARARASRGAAADGRIIAPLLVLNCYGLTIVKYLSLCYYWGNWL
jgi:hypothetical protein